MASPSLDALNSERLRRRPQRPSPIPPLLLCITAVLPVHFLLPFSNPFLFSASTGTNISQVSIFFFVWTCDEAAAKRHFLLHPSLLLPPEPILSTSNKRSFSYTSSMYYHCSRTKSIPYAWKLSSLHSSICGFQSNSPSIPHCFSHHQPNGLNDFDLQN